MRDVTKPKPRWLQRPHRLMLAWLAVIIMCSGALQTRAAFMATQDPDRGAVNRVYEVVHHDEKVLVGAYHKIGRKPYYLKIGATRLAPLASRFVASRLFIKPHPRGPPHSSRAPPRLA